MQTPLISLGAVSLNLGQLLSVVVFVLLGIIFVVWSFGFLRRRLSSRGVNADVTQMVSRAYLVSGFIVLAFMTMDFLQIPLAAFAFISGAIAIGVGFGAQNIINNFISGWIYAIADRSLRVIRSDLRYRIDELFREHNVTISFPQRDVHVDGQIFFRQAPGPQEEARLV